MKKINSVSLTVAAILVAQSTMTTVMASPQTEDFGSTAGRHKGSTQSALTTSAVGSGSIGEFTVIPMVAPKRDFTNWAMNALKAITNGMVFSPTSAFRSSPTNVTTANGFFYVEDVTAVSKTNTSANFWRGSFTPTSDATNEGGDILCPFVSVTASSGGSLALSELVFISTSSDGTNNSLGKVATFETNAYTTNAIGITSSGQIITTGPATQVVQTVIFGVAVPNYVVNDTNQFDGIRSYLESFGTVTNRIEFQVVRDGTVIASNVVNLVLTTNVMAAQPVIRDGGNTILLSRNGGTKSRYPVQSSDEIIPPGSPPTVWTNTGMSTLARVPITVVTDLSRHWFKIVAPGFNQ